MNAALAHKMIAAMAGRGAPLPPPMPGPLHAPSPRLLPLSSSSACCGRTSEGVNE
jgi:hypothetical protein